MKRTGTGSLTIIFLLYSTVLITVQRPLLFAQATQTTPTVQTAKQERKAAKAIIKTAQAAAASTPATKTPVTTTTAVTAPAPVPTRAMASDQVQQKRMQAEMQANYAADLAQAKTVQKQAMIRGTERIFITPTQRPGSKVASQTPVQSYMEVQQPVIANPTPEQQKLAQQQAAQPKYYDPKKDFDLQTMQAPAPVSEAQLYQSFYAPKIDQKVPVNADQKAENKAARQAIKEQRHELKLEKQAQKLEKLQAKQALANTTPTTATTDQSSNQTTDQSSNQTTDQSSNQTTDQSAADATASTTPDSNALQAQPDTTTTDPSTSANTQSVPDTSVPNTSTPSPSIPDPSTAGTPTVPDTSTASTSVPAIDPSITSNQNPTNTQTTP